MLSRLHINLKICHRCKYSQTQRGGCNGPCQCHIDKVDIIDHAKKGDCPKKKFTEPGTMEPVPQPGTELARLLPDIGITGCQCREHVEEMNRQGPDWCEQNIETILSWLRKEADRLGVGGVFTDWGAKLLIRRAIKNARRAK